MCEIPIENKSNNLGIAARAALAIITTVSMSVFLYYHLPYVLPLGNALKVTDYSYSCTMRTEESKYYWSFADSLFGIKVCLLYYAGPPLIRYDLAPIVSSENLRALRKIILRSKTADNSAAELLKPEASYIGGSKKICFDEITLRSSTGYKRPLWELTETKEKWKVSDPDIDDLVKRIDLR